MNENKWEDDLFEFIQEVFIGIETNVYDKIKEKPEFKDKLNGQDAMLYGTNLLEYYLSRIYKQLANKEDMLIVDKFEGFGKKTQEKPLVILNLVANVLMKCYPMFPRSKLNQEDQERYIESVKSITEIMRKYIVMSITTTMSSLKEEQKKKKDQEPEDEQK